MDLYTNRLKLRAFQLSDFEAVHAYSSDPENVYYMVWGPNSPQATLNFISDCIKKGAERPRTAYDFAVINRQSGKLIGGCGLYLDRDLKQAMIGYILHKDFWCMGFGTELASELLSFGFEELKLHRIYATCNAENYGSYRVMERIGMRREALFVKSRYERVGENIVWSDEFVYAILNDEWRKNTARS